MAEVAIKTCHLLIKILPQALLYQSKCIVIVPRRGIQVLPHLIAAELMELLLQLDERIFEAQILHIITHQRANSYAYLKHDDQALKQFSRLLRSKHLSYVKCYMGTMPMPADDASVIIHCCYLSCCNIVAREKVECMQSAVVVMVSDLYRL